MVTLSSMFMKCSLWFLFMSLFAFYFFFSAFLFVLVLFHFCMFPPCFLWHALYLSEIASFMCRSNLLSAVSLRSKSSKYKYSWSLAFHLPFLCCHFLFHFCILSFVFLGYLLYLHLFLTFLGRKVSFLFSDIAGPFQILLCFGILYLSPSLSLSFSPSVFNICFTLALLIYVPEFPQQLLTHPM